MNKNCLSAKLYFNYTKFRENCVAFAEKSFNEVLECEIFLFFIKEGKDRGKKIHGDE
jgi:hypothetical protein